MPTQPVWFHKVDQILGELRLLPASHLDRRALEKLFGLGERRARQLMAGLTCIQVGNAVAVERQALIAWLENVARSSDCEREVIRRERVEKTLQEIRRQANARQVELPATGKILSGSQNLPEGVRLTPAELTVDFNGPKDLAAKLFELSQAMIHDWESFERLCSRKDHRSHD